MTHVIAYSRQQCKHLVSRLNERMDADFVGISSKAGLVANDLKKIDPGIIFFQNGTLISQIMPNTPESKMYASKFNCKFVKVIDLKDRYEGKNE